jgi:signal transduction histidine kinase/DNA-binding response OmpR family regulator
LSKPIDQTKAIELSASQSTFSFDIACLGYLSPEYNTVSYMLEGYDRDWQTLTNGNRHILYMNLPAGKYRLVVKGINNDGMESEPIALDIQVNRPFLLSRFMLFVYLLAALCLIAYAIRRYKRRLEAANQERMLKFSLDKEKELYEAKIGFFTNIAHEIRTPLSLISAPLDAILSSNEANQKTRSNLAIMKSNVQRLLELVNQLLDFRKVESQLMKLNVQSCRVSDVVMSICHRYEEYLRVHHLEMDTTGVQPGILCNLDQEAFVKMIGNLMSNAIKYAKKHISLTLQIRQDDNMLQFEITDDGPGIREEEQSKVFESFYQVDDHGKRPGSGLGLPLALNLAKMHGGNITLHSVYGEGSRFTLTLPMTLETQDASEETPSTTVDETIEKASEPQDVVQVLIVEDNDELRDFVINNLGHPYHVFGAEHGIEALQQLENHSIDVIVSDIMMPEMDGLELCRVIKQNEAYAHIPIILLSAKTDMETKVDGLDIGAAAYLEKPFSMEQLRAQVNSIIENRNRLRERFIKSPLDFYKKPSADDAEERLNAEFVNKLNTLILDNLMNKDFSIDNLARMFYMSRSNFHKRVKGVTGETPNDYIRIVRLNKSAELLATGKYQIVEVCYMVGFNTPSYFSKCFQEHFHKLPKEYLNDL